MRIIYREFTLAVRASITIEDDANAKKELSEEKVLEVAKNLFPIHKGDITLSSISDPKATLTEVRNG